VVSPGWILKAVGAIVALGLLCAYITLCAFFYMGQWQLVLHPSRSVATTPAAVGLNFAPVRFGDDVAGQPQLTGWWMPSDTAADATVLMLHSEKGSMSDALGDAKALHEARLNVFLFDYRGYGQSEGRHPSESLMRADALSALNYLTQTRQLPASSVVVYGSGLGASLATELCAKHTDLPALILVSGDGDTESRIIRDQRSAIVPMRLLLRERFPLADPLSSLHTPKLLISYTGSQPPVEAQRAASPKMTAELPPASPPGSITPVVRRFLDTYVPQQPSVLPLKP
jgi:pimeloyl-ACP methyl ester carboxylesterase